MQYTEVKTFLPDQEFLNFCLVHNKSPEQVGKGILKINKEAELWNRVHPEYGVLQRLEEEKYENLSNIKITAHWVGKEDSHGKTDKSASSRFLSASNPKIATWNSLVNQRCRFYVSYVPNEDDGSVFRVLLDIESLQQ